MSYFHRVFYIVFQRFEVWLALRHLLLISMNQLLRNQSKLTFGNMALWLLSISMGMCSDMVFFCVTAWWWKWLKHLANNTFPVSQNGKPTWQITGPGRVLANFFKFIFVHGVVIVGNRWNMTCFPVLSCSIVQLVLYRNQLLKTFMLCSVWSHYNVMHLNISTLWIKKW